jgi:hypothetical protein
LEKALLLAMRSGKLVDTLHDVFYVCYISASEQAVNVTKRSATIP